MYPTEVMQAAMIKELGFDPLACQQVVASLAPPLGGPPDFAVMARFGTEIELKQSEMTSHAEPAEIKGQPYLRSTDPKMPSFYVADGKTLLAAPDATLLKLVDRQALVAAAVPAHEVGDLAGEGVDMLAVPTAIGEIGVRRRGADFVDQVVAVAQVPGAAIVEQDYRPIGRHVDIAAFVVQRPDLHVGHVAGVADIDGIDQQGAPAIAPAQFPAQNLRAAAKVNVDRLLKDAYFVGGAGRFVEVNHKLARRSRRKFLDAVNDVFLSVAVQIFFSKRRMIQ